MIIRRGDTDMERMEFRQVCIHQRIRERKKMWGVEDEEQTLCGDDLWLTANSNDPQ